MSSIAATVKVNTALAEFLVAIIEHTEEIFDSAPVRQESDYTERNLGEIDAQLFPNFPIIRERAYYEKTSQELRMLSRSLSDCKSLLLNVMIQVSQFIRNGQLCH